MVVLIIVVALAFLVFAIVGSVDKIKDTSSLKAEYDKALMSGDKSAALEAGRAYYSALRNGNKLTLYDEQAISNDLSTMKV